MLREELKAVSRTEQEGAQVSPSQTIERAIQLALKGIRYGSVEIIVHDSKVVQIERKEKMRIDRS